MTSNVGLRSRERLGTVGAYTVLLLLALAALGPTMWVVVSSFSTKQQIYSGQVVPSSLSLDGYRTLFDTADLVSTFANTALYATLGTVGAVVAGFLAAYPSVRMQYPFRAPLSLLFTSGLAIPVVALIVPEFFVFSGLGLYNNKAGLIVFYSALFFPLSFVILRAYLARVPTSIEESARIDGAGYFRILWRIVAPVVRPAIFTVAIIDFISIWNEFLFVLVLAPSPEHSNVQVMLSTFRAQYQFEVGAMLAGTVVVMAIPMVIFVLLQRHVLEGLTAGSIK